MESIVDNVKVNEISKVNEAPFFIYLIHSLFVKGVFQYVLSTIRDGASSLITLKTGETVTILKAGKSFVVLRASCTEHGGRHERGVLFGQISKVV